ncbi:uncharacterized protein LOC125106781 isoform X2 [Lutra lutra]|uniref:uncharacterized protein LOC125106781 isoform X2 n=1 Tax=Lutra lutra TaxID=9657 RepID=UPI001FD11F7E|nr:uncharacterized protein LOC125106781 isoform X2 [Lutra lutra]
MPEEVTYATLKFPNASQVKTSQESYSLKRADNHKVPEMEMDGETENRAGGVESIPEMAESRAVAGHSTQSKVWCTVAFISLTMNLVVLAGLGTLGLRYVQFHSCLESWMWYGNGSQDHAQMNMDSKKNCNNTQVFFRCFPLPIPWVDLDSPFKKTNWEEGRVLKFCIVTCLTLAENSEIKNMTMGHTPNITQLLETNTSLVTKVTRGPEMGM